MTDLDVPVHVYIGEARTVDVVPSDVVGAPFPEVCPGVGIVLDDIEVGTPGAVVVVVHAYELPQAYEWAEGYDSLKAQFRTVAEEVAEDAVSELERGGVQAIAVVRQGPAPQSILDAARVHKADLIVMGSRVRGRENVAEMLLGSVSAYVLRYAPCPVLAVP